LIDITLGRNPKARPHLFSPCLRSPIQLLSHADVLYNFALGEAPSAIPFLLIHPFHDPRAHLKILFSDKSVTCTCLACQQIPPSLARSSRAPEFISAAVKDCPQVLSDPAKSCRGADARPFNSPMESSTEIQKKDEIISPKSHSVAER
jgi:hypothetical protein